MVSWGECARAIVPPARRPVRARHWLLLLTFVVAFSGAFVLLEQAKVVVWTSLPPLALLVLAPWIWWLHLVRHAGLADRRATLVALSRLLLLGLLIAAMAEPRVVRSDDRRAVIFALDHSASIQTASMDRSLAFVMRAVAGKPERDEAGLVFFGRNAAVELPARMSLPFETINVDIDRQGTDLAEVLGLSAAMLPPGREGRIVLISDGVATEGNLPEALEDLAARGVAVDVLPIDYELLDEVWLERLELPGDIKRGEAIEPTVVLSSLREGSGNLVMERNGVVLASKEITWKPGKNRFSMRTVLDSPGYYEFTARVEPTGGADLWSRNNVAMASHHLAGPGSVLLVVKDRELDDRWGHLRNALAERQKRVEVAVPIELPHDPLALLPYDAVVFVDAPRDMFDEVQLEALHEAVFDQGTGFLMLGGADSFGPGGWHASRVEDLMPVSTEISDKKILPKGALAIVLHTCEFAAGNTWGKRITAQAMKVLSPRDEVGLLAYDYNGGDRWLFPLTEASKYPTLVRIVNNAQIGDMPGFANTMQLALTGLNRSDAAAKHVLIISDGDPTPPPPALLQSYIDAKVSVSTVAINPHRPTDTKVMQGIAANTGGRFYNPSSPEQLPGIFIKEAKTIRRSAVVNRTFTPVLTFPATVMRGLDRLPPLHGYVLTTLEPGAVSVLEASASDEQVDPVLARWRYGVAVTSAFTSDLGIHWGRDWLSWSRYSAFVNQLVEDVVRSRQKRELQVKALALRGEGLVQVEDHAAEERVLDLIARVGAPGGEETLRLQQVAPRRYEARFPLRGVGRYRVVVTAAGEEERLREYAGFAVPFSQEFLRFRADPLTLRRIAERTGGRVLDGSESGAEVYSPERTPSTVSRSIVDWLLVFLACLIPLDVALRRVQIDWGALRAWLWSEREADATLDTLRRRKAEVAAGMGRTRRPVPPPADSGREGRAPRARERPSGTAPSGHAVQAGEDGLPDTTTGRLLALKRRGSDRQPDEQDPDE